MDVLALVLLVALVASPSGLVPPSPLVLTAAVAVWLVVTAAGVVVLARRRRG